MAWSSWVLLVSGAPARTSSVFLSASSASSSNALVSALRRLLPPLSSFLGREDMFFVGRVARWDRFIPCESVPCTRLRVTRGGV